METIQDVGRIKAGIIPGQNTEFLTADEQVAMKELASWAKMVVRRGINRLANAWLGDGTPESDKAMEKRTKDISFGIRY